MDMIPRIKGLFDSVFRERELWNKPCIVIGSAPNPTPPKSIPEDAVLICINMSGWSAKRMGLRSPDITILAGNKLTLEERAAERTLLAGLKTKEVLYVHKKIYVPLEKAKKILKDLEYSYEKFTLIEKKKHAIIEDVLGTKLDKTYDAKVSNGVFAVCYALYMGASEVILSGISLASTGHNYDVPHRDNLHIHGDGDAFKLLIEKGYLLKTTEAALAKETGMELV